MKRPLAWIGLSYLLAAAAAVSLRSQVCAAVAAALTAFGFLAALSRHPFSARIAAVLLASSAGFVMVLLATELKLEPARSLAGRTLTVSGRVTQVSGPRSIQVKTDEGVAVAVFSRESMMAKVGEDFSAPLALTLYEEGDPSAYAARRAKLTPLRGFVAGEPVITPPPAASARYYLTALREALLKGLRENLPGEEGQVLAAMLLGERGGIGDELEDCYKAAGISHLLAISGYHVALLGGFFGGLFRLATGRKKLSALLTGAVVLIYMALAGFTPSVTRAGIMALLCLAGSLLGRDADPLTSLGIAGLTICGLNPLAAADTGLQLSFLAAWGILVLSPRLNAWMERRGRAGDSRLRAMAAGSLSATLSATAATLPVTIVQFRQAALYGPVANLLAAPLIPVALVGGLAAMLLAQIPLLGVLAKPFALAAGLAVMALNGVARLTAQLPFARLPAGAGFVFLWMAGAALLAAAATVNRSPKKTKACVLLCLILLMVGAVSYQAVMRGSARAAVMRTDRGAVLLAVKDGQALLAGKIETKSDAYQVSRLLEEYGVRQVDLLLLDPMERERPGGVSVLLAERRVESAVLGPGDLADRRMEQALAGSLAVYPWAPLEAEFLQTGRLRLEEHGLAVELEGVRLFLLDGECDILDLVPKNGAPHIAVLAGGQPENSGRLRADFIVDCGTGYSGSGRAATVRLEENGTAAFLLKDGKIRLLN